MSLGVASGPPVYTALEPCRIMDTRNATLASGVQGPISGGVLKQLPGFVTAGGNWTQYGQTGTPSDCGLTNPPGTSIKAVAIVITILNPELRCLPRRKRYRKPGWDAVDGGAELHPWPGLVDHVYCSSGRQQYHLFCIASWVISAAHLRRGRLLRRLRRDGAAMHDAELGGGDDRSRQAPAVQRRPPVAPGTL